jgi:hypothetical protein
MRPQSVMLIRSSPLTITVSEELFGGLVGAENSVHAL